MIEFFWHFFFFSIISEFIKQQKMNLGYHSYILIIGNYLFMFQALRDTTESDILLLYWESKTKKNKTLNFIMIAFIH